MAKRVESRRRFRYFILTTCCHPSSYLAAEIECLGCDNGTLSSYVLSIGTRVNQPYAPAVTRFPTILGEVKGQGPGIRSRARYPLKGAGIYRPPYYTPATRFSSPKNLHFSIFALYFCFLLLDISLPTAPSTLRPNSHKNAATYRQKPEFFKKSLLLVTSQLNATQIARPAPFFASQAQVHPIVEGRIGP
ncbi:MAG: hypothetical protein ACYS76_12400, partial [Planctomycetota bacterium]